MESKKTQLLEGILRRRIRNIFSNIESRLLIASDLCDVTRFGFSANEKKMKKLLDENNYICIIVEIHYFQTKSGSTEPSYKAVCISKGQTKEECIREALKQETMSKLETMEKQSTLNAWTF